MTRERFVELMHHQGDDDHRTEEEKAHGVHICWDWDGLVIDGDMQEICSCTCYPDDHILYKRKQEFLSKIHNTQIIKEEDLY